MKPAAWGASALVVFALTVQGEAAPSPATVTAPAAKAVATAPSSLPTVKAVETSSPPDPAASAGEPSHWWSFDKGGFLNALGVDESQGIAGFGRWHTIVDLGANGNLQRTTTANAPTQEFFSYLTDQGITVQNNGWYVLDPRLVTGAASVRFGLQQAHQDAGNVSTAQNADVTDYYLNVGLLPEKPYNATLQASHVEFVTSHAGGGTTSSSHSLQGATLFLREGSILRDKEIAPFFSASLQGAKEDLQETTTNAGQQFRRDEQRDLVRFDAHNGFLTGDLTVDLEQVDLANKIFPEGSYRNRSADATYSLDFGKSLTRHSDTHINYNERTGDFGTETLNLDQYLFFEHNAFLSSTLHYIFDNIDSVAGSSTTNRADAGVQYLPFLNVSTSIDASGSRVEYDTGTIEGYGGSAGANYSNRLPLGGSLSMSVNGGLNYTDSQLSSSLLPVVDAPYQAPPALGAGAGFLLNEANVVTSTIVIFNVRGGARLPTVVGIDYEVETEGNRTKIVPLATSAVIQGGDPLQASYTYLTDANLKSRIGTQSYFISADWVWIAVSLTHDITKQEPLSGQTETLLSDQDRTTLRLDLRHDWGDWRALGNARAARYRDERLNYDEVRLNENLTWRPSYDWQLTGDASQTQAEFIDTGRTSRHFDARLGGTWHSERGWWLDGYLNWRTQQDSEMVDETITEGFLRVRRNWPQLAVICSVAIGQRDRDTVKTMYENFQVNFTRTF